MLDNKENLKGTEEDLKKKEVAGEVENTDEVKEEEKDPRYTVKYTLIRGKQNAKKVLTKEGEKVTYHKKAMGYVLEDHENNNSLEAMTHLEATEEVLLHGATNAIVTATPVKNSEGKKVPSPYIRASSGAVALQDPELVRDPDKLLPANPEIKVTKTLAKTLANKVRTNRGESKRTEPMYSNDVLLKALQAKKEEIELIEE